MLPDNVFLKIINRELPATIHHDDDYCLAFSDRHPQAPTHVLIIPKREIPTHAHLEESDAQLIGHMHLVAAKVARELGLQKGYRLVINCDDGGGQTVPHLHMHLIGGRELGWPPG